MEKRIGFLTRFGAAIIDYVLVSILSVVLGATIGGLLGVGAGATSEAGAMGGMAGGVMGMMAGILIGAPVIATIYFLIEGVLGASPGKMMLGIKIGNADGSRASIGSYLIRWGVKNIYFILGLIAALTQVGIIGTIGMILGLIIFIGCFFVLTAKRQAFHDMAAKTAIFKRSDLT